MTFKAMVQSALADIEIARHNQLVERLDLGYDIYKGFEIFTITKESSHCIQFFDRDKEFSVYRCLYRVKKEVESRNERLILAFPGGYVYPLFRPHHLPSNRKCQIGPFDYRQERLSRRQRCVGMLAKDFEGNVFLTNSIKFNSRNVKSVVELGVAVIDNYKLTKIAENRYFYYDFHAIGMRTNGEIIIINTRDYKDNSEWLNVLVANDCCDAAIISSPNSDYYLRNKRENENLKTYGGFIAYAIHENDIRELIWDELSLKEMYKYYLLSR